jgi:hypothetical protein
MLSNGIFDVSRFLMFVGRKKIKIALLIPERMWDFREKYGINKKIPKNIEDG